MIVVGCGVAFDVMASMLSGCLDGTGLAWLVACALMWF